MGLREEEAGIHHGEVVTAPGVVMADRKAHKVVVEEVITASEVAIPSAEEEALQWTVLLQLAQR